MSAGGAGCGSCTFGLGALAPIGIAQVAWVIQVIHVVGIRHLRDFGVRGGVVVKRCCCLTRLLCLFGCSTAGDHGGGAGRRGIGARI